MSAIQLRNRNGVILAEDELFVVDIIDLLRGADDELLFTWNGSTWRGLDGTTPTQLSLEPTDPDGTLEVRFRDLASPSLELTHSWSGKGPLEFVAGLGDQLNLMAPTRDSQERLARLDYARGIWSAEAPGSFDKILFSATVPGRPFQTPRRDRLASLAERSQP